MSMKLFAQKCQLALAFEDCKREFRRKVTLVSRRQPCCK